MSEACHIFQNFWIVLIMHFEGDNQYQKLRETHVMNYQICPISSYSYKY